MSETNAMSIAAMLSDSVIPAPAPRAAASMMLTSLRSTSNLTSPRVRGSPVSGTSILAITIAAGAFMMLAARRNSASAPKPMYTPSTAPEIVAIPPIITSATSEYVILSM